MKNLLIISFLLLVGLSGFGQDVAMECSKFKTGIFSFEKGEITNVKIKRGKSKQIELHLESKSKVISTIEWVSECEFILTCIKVNKPINDKYVGGKFNVKILSTTEDSYTYEATFQNGVKKTKTHYRIK